MILQTFDLPIELQKWSNINKKCPMNKKADKKLNKKANNKIDKKIHFIQLT